MPSALGALEFALDIASHDGNFGPGHALRRKLFDSQAGFPAPNDLNHDFQRSCWSGLP